MADKFRSRPERGSDEIVSESCRELGGGTEISKFDFSGSGQENIGGFDVTMNSALAMKVVETEEQLTTDGSDVCLGKDTSFKEIETRSTLEKFHNDPQLVVDHERSIITRHVFRVALSEVDDFPLDC